VADEGVGVALLLTPPEVEAESVQPNAMNASNKSE
jgi:hypothetical protein